jgi:antitoxin CptB
MQGATSRPHEDVRCRRLLFRSWHRGTQENDSSSARSPKSLARLDSTQLDRFEALLECPDTYVILAPLPLSPSIRSTYDRLPTSSSSAPES